MVPLLKPLTANNFTVKDSFEFSKEILKQNSKLYMASLDIDSLFKNIPLEETINISVESLFSENEFVQNLSKESFTKLLTLATNESFFIF